MKYLFAITLLLIVACNDSSSKREDVDSTRMDAPNMNNDEPREPAVQEEGSRDPKAAQGKELISKSDCFSCHKPTEYSIGPAYSQIAQKYKAITPATMDSMVTQIINGGMGKWGSVPMTPHPQITKEDAELMVHYIMSVR